MRIAMTVLVLCILFLTGVIGGLLTGTTLSGETGVQEEHAARPVAQSSDARSSPYASDPDHPWNRLHQALFVREAADGSPRVHPTDPLLGRGGKFILEGEPHRRAVSLLDQVLDGPDDRPIQDPLKRLFFQRDLWAAFDQVAWYPDEWVHHSRHEPAAIALRTRLAKAIRRLALNDREFDALPDNYALWVKSKQYPAAQDPGRPERPFLPPDLFDPTGPWVRFHEVTAEPMARRHFDGAGGRAAHAIFLRLPEGRATTEKYLKELNRDSVKQFPPGTMVAMVRRALAVDRSAKVRVTPVTELVQLRVYRRIPADPHANRGGDFGEQDAYEFVLDRMKLYAGQHGLREVGPDDPAEPFAGGEDAFGRPPANEQKLPQLKTCIQCHQQPGVHSVLSMQRGLGRQDAVIFNNEVFHGEVFRTYAWDVEMSYTVKEKVKRFDWGLLQGNLETR